MYFSDSVGIDYQESFDWFDPLLDTDTSLFVDPFLIFKDTTPEWKGAHDELIGYFQDAFELLAPSWDKPTAQRYVSTQTVMTFPEPKEFGLGLVAEGRDGAGTGGGFAKKITEAMADAIERGLQDMAHFEELGLLVKGIHRDRISDITCNILKRRFINYTQRVCRDHDIPTEDILVASAVLDRQRMRRVGEVHSLPINKETGDAVLLVPKRFLREIPTLNANEWWQYAEPELRADLNLNISLNVDKNKIVELARSNADKMRAWSEAAEKAPAQPYPVDWDPAGLHDWLSQGRAIVRDHPMTFVVSDHPSLDQFIEQIVSRFTHFVEAEGGWRLLWNDDTLKPKREDSIQLLFKGVVQSYCRANNVILDREVELGRGPVDFIISENATERVLLEIKKVSSGKLIDGLEKQLLSYLESGECGKGWYLTIRFYDSPSETRKVSAMRTTTSKLNKSTRFTLRTGVVDATRKVSASKL